MQKTKLLTIMLFVTILSLPAFVLSASATNVPSFKVTNLSQLPIELPSGTTFNGSIAASDTIRFWVSAPEGAQLVNLGLVDEPTKFSFVAPTSGNYTLYFENDVLGAAPVQVNFSFTTNPDISGDSSTGLPLSYLAVVVIIGVVGSVAIFVLIRRSERSKQHNKV